MSADRLLALMQLLRADRRITARELAERLGVSERTVLRDMEALSASGVPVVAMRGVGGGWSLLEEHRPHLSGLKPEEVQALFLSPPARLLDDVGLRRAAEDAAHKLLSALPIRQRAGAEAVRQRLHIDAPGWRAEEASPPALPVLQEAVWGERRLSLSYTRADGTPSERVVDPLGLVVKGRAWYLVAAREGEVRTYRVSRITRATLLEESAVRPEGFDLVAHWQASSAQLVASLPSFHVRARISPLARERLRMSGRYAQLLEAGEPDARGWMEARLRFDTEDVACEFALGLGTEVEVLEPAALREQVVARARAVLAAYT